MPEFDGALVHLRTAVADDIPDLVRIRGTPEVSAHWRGGDDLRAAVEEDFAEPASHPYAIEVDDRVVGWIQWAAEEEPEYRHASIDIYLDPAVDNLAAICAYAKVGFRPVGITRRSERGPDGTWHDSLLMDLLAEELAPGPE